MEPRPVTCEVVKQMLEGPMAESTLVVDVRDDDFGDGHIPGALNWVVDNFNDTDGIDELVDKHLDGKERVVVHCMLSQQRGPYAARRLAGRLAQLGKPLPYVLVMQGGFSRWARLGYPRAG
ncbi:MAG: Rhodanese-like protein [Monoraphidium minutum]|nr:MAG: Rhodanese-like protein [Monoraphidium minutum]